ncbi:MAG: hypothetical protein LBH25_02940 [Fibromonadaceae bacterium]|nr:hypothetical protein [Fibromonadaceae bacterium]
MIKILTIIIVLIQTVFAQAIWNGSVNTAWYKASQSEFIISTPEQLAGFAELVNDGNNFEGKTVKLSANILLNDTANWKNWASVPPANSWIPIGKFISNKKVHWFLGVFDGNGFAVSGIYINSSAQNQGLFERMGYSGTIKNLAATASYIKGESWVGGIAGRSYGTIINSYFKGTIAGQGGLGGITGLNGGTIRGSYSAGMVKGTSNVIGGFAGQNGGTISGSYSAGEVSGESSAGGFAGLNKGTINNSYSTASVKGKWKIGGLAGWNWSGNINNSYSTGTVSGESSVGGFVGDNLSGTINSSYSIGKTTGKERVGGLVGDYKGTVSNSFYNKETSSQSDEKGMGKTTVQMKQQYTFTHWDFNKIWNINETKNNGYPYLLGF